MATGEKTGSRHFLGKKSNTAAAVIKITGRVLDAVVFSFWI